MLTKLTKYLAHHHLGLLALFVALGGTAHAAIQLGANDVKSRHIGKGQVKRADLAKNAVNSSKVANGSLVRRDFAGGQLLQGEQGPPGPPGSPDTPQNVLAKLVQVDGGGSGLDADRLNGKASDEILMSVRAQRDDDPNLTSFIQSGDAVTMNTVAISAPVDGVLVLIGSVGLRHFGGAGNQAITVIPRIDGAATGSQPQVTLVPAGPTEYVNFATTVPVAAGAHTVTTTADRTSGTGSWTFNRNNLTVTFVPSGQGAVTGVGFGG
jgi:hypothetical protein